VITHVPWPGEDTPLSLLTPDPGLVLFDLDGVLTDTLPVMRSEWEAVRARHGIDVPFSSYVQHLGRPFSDLLAVLGVPHAQDVGSTYDTVSFRDAQLARPFPAPIAEAV
jgi:beta-phosphoglucomutase-like phosphatase (HAD superfamily)